MRHTTNMLPLIAGAFAPLAIAETHELVAEGVITKLPSDIGAYADHGLLFALGDVWRLRLTFDPATAPIFEDSSTALHELELRTLTINGLSVTTIGSIAGASLAVINNASQAGASQPLDAMVMDVDVENLQQLVHFSFGLLLGDSSELVFEDTALPTTLNLAALPNSFLRLTSGTSIDSGRGDVSFLSLAPLCVGDLDHDRVVGPSDLAMLLACWGAASFPGCDANLEGPPGDLVDAADLAALLSQWGACDD